MKNKTHLSDKMNAHPQERSEFIPLVDIYEKEDAIQLYCDLPGVRQEDLEITLDNQKLIIRGEQTEFKTEGLDGLWGEYESGRFQRTFKVSPLVDEANINAHLAHGVLELTLPKSKAAQPRKIVVHAA